MIYFKRTNSEVGFPERNNGNAFDMRSTVFANIKPGKTVEIPLGFSAEIVNEDNQPKCFLLLPRSSLGKKGIMLANTVGLIDDTYRGELIALLHNYSDKNVLINKNDRIVQLLIVHVSMDSAVAVDSLSETDRGDGGFGSTGDK